MLLKTKQIVAATKAAQDLAQANMPGVAAFKMRKNLKAMEAILVPYEETRVCLVKTHGVEDKDGNYSITDPHAIKCFNAELIALLEHEQEVDIQQILVSDLDNAIINPSALIAADFLIKE